MIFAEGVPTPPEAAALGSVLQTILYLCCSVSSLIIAGAAVWAIIAKSKMASPESHLVTRGEMKSEMTSLKLEIGRDITNMKTEINRDHARIETQLKELVSQERGQSRDMERQIKELTDYTHKNVHDQRDIQHAYNLRMHQMLTIVTQLAHKADIPVGPEPTISTKHEV